MEKIKLIIENMDCPSCAGTIEKNLPDKNGILSAQVNFASKAVIIEYSPDKTNTGEIAKKLKLLGFGIKDERKKGSKNLYYYIAFTVVPLLVILQQIISPHHLHSKGFPVASLAVIFAFGTFKSAYISLRRKNITAELYMSLGILVTFFMGEFVPSAVIVLFQNIGQFLDESTSAKAASAIQEIIKISPEKARIINGTGQIEVPAEEVKINDIVLVKSGEKIPVDGVIIEGNGFVNQSSITGESIPQEKIPGLEVYASSILEEGFLKVKTAKTYHNTVFYKIINLIEEADKQKSKVQKIADKFAAYFLPAILFIAATVFLLSKNLNSAVAVIIVACPCSIAVATPLAVMASAGSLARSGIIIKGGLSLEVLSKVNVMVMDKTGTITIGEPEVSSIKSFADAGDMEVLSKAASCEIYSEHLLAKAIIKKAKELKIYIEHPDNIKVVPGKGITAYTGSDIILMGNKFLFDGIKIPEEAVKYVDKIEKEGQSSILIAYNNIFYGVIGIQDRIRDEIKQAITNLNKLGIKDIYIVTGDNKAAAESLAKKINIDKVYSEQLPEDKVNVIKDLQKDGKTVVFVGDGINDAPALKTADLSIAMGVAGTHIAVETADIILMNDNLKLLPLAVKQGKRTASTIKQNIFFGLTFNILGVIAASIGLLAPIWAAMAHVIPDVFVFGNSAKLIRRIK
ncbi:MAG: cation-translocating P-type ATPase [Armatimonadota bacterium]